MAPLRISVYDQSLTRVGILFEFVSLTWEETYNDVGALQIVVNKDRTMTSLFKIGYFIGIPDSDELCIITGLEDKQTAEGSELWVHGFEAKWILGNRVYNNAKVAGGNIETRLKSLCGNGRLDLVTVAASHGLTATTDAEHAYPTLLELCEDFCKPVDYGYKLTFDQTNKKLVFDVWNGSTITSVKYSTRYGNLFNLERRKMINGAKNAAYVLAEEVEGQTRQVLVVTLDGVPGQADINRWGFVVDASDIKHEDGQTAEQYTALLQARGLEALAEKQPADEIAFQVDPEDYRKVFKVGDKLTCILPEYDEVVTVRVTEARVVYEDNKRGVELTLGQPIKRRRKD